MHKLHSHHFKHTIISKIPMDMHLLMLHLLEEILRKHCMHSLKSKRQSTLNTQLAQTMIDFKDSLAKFTSTLSFQEKGKFPSQPQQNVKGPYNANASSSGSHHIDQVKSVITLRSGKVIEKLTLEACEKYDESISEGKEGVESEHCKEKTDSPLVLLFPHPMTKQRKVNHNSEIFETFKQVRISIPLLNAIKQIPFHAKYLKDLCTVKRKLILILIWKPRCLNAWQVLSFIGQNFKLLIWWLIVEWEAISWLGDNPYLLVWTKHHC